MIILPNFFERYTASLRILTSLLILKNGLNIKYLKNLSKIYTAEAFFESDSKKPLELEKFCFNILCAVWIIKLRRQEKFEFKIDLKGIFLINPKLLTVLLLNLSKESKKIIITEKGNHIVIDFKGSHKKSLSALKRLQGFYFYSSKFSSGKLIIPCHKTTQKSKEFSGVIENICDQYSPVNLFFENLV